MHEGLKCTGQLEGYACLPVLLVAFIHPMSCFAGFDFVRLIRLRLIRLWS